MKSLAKPPGVLLLAAPRAHQPATTLSYVNAAQPLDAMKTHVNEELLALRTETRTLMEQVLALEQEKASISYIIEQVLVPSETERGQTTRPSATSRSRHWC